MRKFLIILLSATGLMGILYAYSLYNVEQDDLDVALREINYLRLKPASKLHTVGALYFIAPDLSDYTPICSPTPEVLAKYVHYSPSEKEFGDRTFQGTYTSHIKANADQLINGKGSIGDSRFIRVHYELTHVNISAIDVAPSGEVYDQLMNMPSCSKAVLKYLNLSGYICQDLGLLVASALFKLDSETDASADLDTKTALASEIEAATNVHLTDTKGRSAAEALQWGIRMAPLCMAPPWALYQRTLPRNKFDRMLNFIKFNILEPIRRAI
jgi:hypothetical protein